MARLRKGVSYRRKERPYTRVSKFSNKAYVKGAPVCKISRFDMGTLNNTYDFSVSLSPTVTLQIRQNALESARQSCNKLLEDTLGKNFYFKVRVYPFHVLRENPLAMGAGADRFSTGMSHAFGKPIGTAAQVKEGQTIFEVRVNAKDLSVAKKALLRATYKLPCKCHIVAVKMVSARELV